MIVRESVASAVPVSEPQWPPKSPHEVLLSSPSGRKKLQQLQDNRSSSPSPLRRPTSAVKAGSHAARLLSDEVEEEDEETLQLQLQAIEARLKLKKLQQTKAKQAVGSSVACERDVGSKPGAATSGRQDGSRKSESLRSQPAIQIPLSPVKDRKAQERPKSPSRVILGIGQGLRAQDISLKRASSLGVKGDASKNGLGFRSYHSDLQRNAHASAPPEGDASASRPKSFSERIAASRMGEKEREEKEERIRKARSRGFDADVGAVSGNRDGQSSSTSDHRQDRINGDGKRNERSSAIPPHRKEPDTAPLRQHMKQSGQPTYSKSSAAPGQSNIITQFVPKRSNSLTPAANDDPSETTDLDPFTNFHLSKRLLSHAVLFRALEGKELYPLPRLLHTVKSPDYDPPDHEADFVVLGIIASKSAPRAHKSNLKVASTGDPDEAGRSKFMVLRLTDLKWEVDLFLFGTGFEQFWKLTLGTVVAILNPGILPPRNRDTGAFSLKLASSEDTVLEIGTAKDLGFCRALKKNGMECGAWIDRRKTEVCDFHVHLQLEKMKAGRMEVNTMKGYRGGAKGRDGGGGGGGGRGLFGNSRPFGGGGRFKDNGLIKEGRVHDAFLHETYYIAPSSRSAAALLDADDVDPDAYGRGMSKDERKKKRDAEKEKERDLALKLGTVGGGMGSEYMRVKHRVASRANVEEGDGMEESPFEPPKPPDAKALGLLGNRAEDVKLSPSKRKRGRDMEAKTKGPVGWSRAFRRGLGSPSKEVDGKPGEVTSPVKKKTKFGVQEKGVAEPRKSLGNVGTLGRDHDGDKDDDDDGLEII